MAILLEIDNWNSLPVVNKFKSLLATAIGCSGNVEVYEETV